MSFKKVLRRNTEKKIWKLLHDPGANHLLFELRDTEAGEASFSLIELSTGKEVFDGLYFEETWWVGASILLQEKIVFHTIDDDQDPSSKSCFVYDYIDNEVIWQKKGLTISRVSGDHCFGFVKDDEGQKPITLSLSSGEEISNTPFSEEQSVNPVYPRTYTPDSDAHATISEYILEAHSQYCINEIGYLEHKEYIIITYYVKNEGSNQLTNFLWLMDKDGNTLCYEALDEDLSGVAQDSFYMIDDFLIYILKKTEICIYEL